MNLIECIKIAREDQGVWFRPIRWRNGMSAMVVQGNDILVVPDPRGGHVARFLSPDDMIGEWELVTPDEVLNGG